MNSTTTTQIDPAVNAVIAGWQRPVREAALEVRHLIFDTASTLPQVGNLSEMLKWNQPAYLTARPVPVQQSGWAKPIRCERTKTA